MSGFWSGFIAIISLINIFACVWLIRWTSKPKAGEVKQGEPTEHVWDDDLRELNNPMPRWWLGMFYISIVFGLIYLLLYPGLGTWKGLLGWDQIGQYQSELDAADLNYAPIFSAYANQDVDSLIKDNEAMLAGQRLFLNYCSGCHGSDAQGAKGYPNLTDNDWLYGGTAEHIKTSIDQGRSGAMPPMGAALGELGVAQTAEYVLSLSGRDHDKGQAEIGAKHYAQLCAACHAADGAGSTLIGAPNLRDKTWLYGRSLAAIRSTISLGRNGVMPPHGELLGNDKLHLLTAYIYSLPRR